MSTAQERYIQWSYAAVRIVLGWIFFWAFLDKLFGLGFSTPSAKSWLNGGSPTLGFLKSAKGPFENMFHAMAGTPVVNWLFMIGLCCIGIALILGIGMKIAGYSGTVLVLLMWMVVLPPTQNPIVDDHIVYAIVLMMLTLVPAGDTFGLGKWWKSLSVVKKYPILQ